MSRLKRRVRDDQGFSLTELLVSMTIFSVLMALIFGLLITMTYQASDNIGRTRSVEEARLGLSQIDRQVRSGNLILDPAMDGETQSGVEPNYSLRILTQEGGGAPKCVQWRVIDENGDGFAELQFRRWDPGPVDVQPWTRVASNVVAPEVKPIDANDPESWPPFWLDPNLSTGTEAQNIRVTLRLKDPKAREDSRPIPLTTVLTGRNTVFGAPIDECNPVPSPGS